MAKGPRPMPIKDRFLTRCIPEPMSGCWLWLGNLSGWGGYGTMRVKSDTGAWVGKLAHRLSYELFVGPIPAGLDIDHKCRNRACVNPEHLEPVTRSENLRRSPLMGRQSHKTHCRNGHPFSGVNNVGHRICHICAAAASRRHQRKEDRHV